jgi:hypothetical protein
MLLLALVRLGNEASGVPITSAQGSRCWSMKASDPPDAGAVSA